MAGLKTATQNFTVKVSGKVNNEILDLFVYFFIEIYLRFAI